MPIHHNSIGVLICECGAVAWKIKNDRERIAQCGKCGYIHRMSISEAVLSATEED